MSAKAKVIPFQPPVIEDDDDDCDCPKCPPAGAPAWLATFADIATNLMAFFVLILGFAQFDEPSFKKFAGAMRDQFGASMIDGRSKGDTIIEMAPMMKPGTSEMEGSAPGEEAPPTSPEARAVAEALREALADGSMEVDTGAGSVTLKLPGGGAEGAAAALALADAIAEAAGGDVARSEAPPQPPAAAGQAETGTVQPADGAGGGGSGSAGVGNIRAELAGIALESTFAGQIAEGKLEVEQKDGKVFVTLGAGGSFQSGSADLSAEAEQIMDKIAVTGSSPGRSITVTGHTDDVPLAGGPYGDNFGLAAARAASVVRALIDSGEVDPAQIAAVSKGEFAPVADNATEEGRARNRRIEIEIDYGE